MSRCRGVEVSRCRGVEAWRCGGVEASRRGGVEASRQRVKFTSKMLVCEKKNMYVKMFQFTFELLVFVYMFVI